MKPIKTLTGRWGSECCRCLYARDGDGNHEIDSPVSSLLPLTWARNVNHIPQEPVPKEKLRISSCVQWWKKLDSWTASHSESVNSYRTSDLRFKSLCRTRAVKLLQSVTHGLLSHKGLSHFCLHGGLNVFNYSHFPSEEHSQIIVIIFKTLDTLSSSCWKYLKTFSLIKIISI